jgi:glutathione reductase (NADPH)
MTEHTVDVLVVGTGAAGKTVAYGCREGGLSVAVVDNRPYGGTCQNRGCDPKKVLVGATEAWEFAQQLHGKGITYQDLCIDWPALMQFKKTFVEHVPESNEAALKAAGIQTFHGTATCIDKSSVSINGDIIQAKTIVIASGATPMKLGIPGEEHATISDGFLDLPTLPKRIIFIGGGYISFEFAHIARRAGAEVTILHRSEHVLHGFDQDLVQKLLEATRALGITVLLNTPVAGIEKTDTFLTVHTTAKDGTKKSLTADLVVHGAGRVPYLADLALEKVGVAYDKKGVLVNEYMQSVSNSSVYAAGDAAAYGLPLTPVAGKEGYLVVDNILNAEKRKADFKVMPSVVFTLPPLATVGLKEDEARAKGYDFTVKFADTSSWYSSRRINERVSGYKTLVEKGTGRVLGAHLLGHNAEEVVNLFALAIAKDLSADDLKNLICSYPTKSSDIQYML